MMLHSRVFILLTACLASILGQELCDENGNGSFDGILTDPENQLRIVKGDNYWKLNGNLTDGFSLLPGYPKKLHTHWPGLNDSIDEAFYDIENGNTYFVKGELAWAFNGTLLLPGYPKPAKEDPYFDSEEDLDDDSKRWYALADTSRATAIFPFALSHVYFFNGTEYSKYRLPAGPIEPGYPKPVVPFWIQCPVPVNEV